MVTKTWTAPAATNGKWSDTANWSPSTPVDGDQVAIGSPTQIGAITVSEDTTIAVTSLALAGSSKSNSTTTLLVTQTAVLTVNGPITIGANSTIGGGGTLVANGAITGAGTILPAAGLLDITGTGTIGSGVVIGFSTTSTAASTLKLDLSGGVTSAQAIKMNAAAQTLEIGASTNLTINAVETISKGTLRMSGGTLTDASGVIIGGQGTSGTITGFGTIAANVADGGGKSATITAAGGILDLTGAISHSALGTLVAAIDTASASTLKFDAGAVLAQPIVINNANQTLEIGALGSLAITGTEAITNGTIRMDGGTLSDAQGLVIDTGAILIGSGTIASGTALSGAGTVIASGGRLDLAGDLTAAATNLQINAAPGSVLEIDGAVASGVTITFLGSAGALELTNLANFNGSIAGLNVGASAAGPTNEINIQGPVTNAVLSGNILTIFNGSTAVAALTLSGTLAHGAYAVMQADTTLGGEDIYLSNEPPVAPVNPALDFNSDSGVPGDNVTNIGSPVITGTGLVGDTITLFDGATQIGAGTVDANGNWAITASALTEGVNAITATQTDAHGNVSAATAPLNITLDTTAPIVTVALSSDTGASALDSLTNNPSLSGTAEANGTVVISNGGVVLGAAVADANGVWSFAPVGLTNGDYFLFVTEDDAAGNTGVTAIAFTLDHTAPLTPSAPALSAASDSGVLRDNLTNVATPTFFGAVEANATVTLFDGTTVIGSAQANAGGAWMVQASVLADGVHAISVTATDAAGNISAASAPLSVTIDTAAPVAPSTPDLVATSDSGISSTDNVTRVTTPTFAGTAEANATVTLFDGTTVIGTTHANAAGAWSVAASVLTNGIHAISAKATDLAGNVSAASGSLSVTIDTIAPAAPSVPDLLAGSDSGPSSTDNVTNVTAPTFAGTAEANATVTLFDGVTVVGSGQADAAGAWSITTSTLADGKHGIRAKATDVAGNVGGISTPLTVTIDTAAPVAPSTPDLVATSDSGISSTDNVTRVTTPTFAGTAEANATVTLFDGTTVIGTTHANAAGAWSVAASVLTNGIHAISAKATDLAGNVSAASGSLSVTIDTIAPAAPSVPDLLAGSDSGPSSTDNVTNVTAPTFAGTAEANATVTLFDGVTVVGSGQADATGAWSITTSTLADGKHGIRAKATDVAGNVGGISTPLTVTIDTAAPVAPSTPDLVATSDSGISSTDNVTRVTTPTFAGTAEANATVTLFDGTTVIGTTHANAAGAWSVAASVLTNGIHAISAKATDLAGNVSAASGSLSVTIDTIAPAAPSVPDLLAGSDSGPSSTDNVTNVTAPTFAGTAEANATVTLFDGVTVVGSGQADATGAWSITTSTLADGKHGIRAKATDVAGNVGGISAPLTVTIDTAAPVAPSTPDLVAASDSGISNSDNVTRVTTPTFAGTAEANATVTLFDGAVEIGTGHANGAGIWSVTGSPLADGVHAITATATDAAGNVGAASGSLSVTIDTTPPVSSAITHVTKAFISGNTEANAAIALFDGALRVGTASADGTGAWSVPLILASGAHSLVAQATDLAGNMTPSAAVAVIAGTSGNDVLSSGPGVVTLLGKAGNDTFIVDNSLDSVMENIGDGSDTVLASVDFTLAAGSEIEFLKANTTAGITLTGNEFANTIIGGAGNDTLIGGGGNDTMTGGLGNDIFKYTTANFGADIITDFGSSPGASQDLIDISGLGITAATFASSVTIGGGANALISVAGGTISLTGVNQSAIGMTNFKLA